MSWGHLCGQNKPSFDGLKVLKNILKFGVDCSQPYIGFEIIADEWPTKIYYQI
jgi:hypothetical protein